MLAGLIVTEIAGQIVRVWKGYGSAEGVQRYCDEHFAPTVLPQLRRLNGFVGARVLVRTQGKTSELVVETLWTSMDAIKVFAGDDLEKAVVEPVVSEILERVDDRVAHYFVAMRD